MVRPRTKGYWKIQNSSQVAEWERIILSMQGTPGMRVRSLCQEGPLEYEMAAHCSILAWKIIRTEESGGLQCMGSQRIGKCAAEHANTQSHNKGRHWHYKGYMFKRHPGADVLSLQISSSQSGGILPSGRVGGEGHWLKTVLVVTTERVLLLPSSG